MAYANLPKDQNGHVIQALSLEPTLNVKGAVAATTARVALPAGDVVRIASTTDCYIRFGDSSVEAAATDAVFPIGSEFLKVPSGATHMAFIRVTADGVISVTAAA